MVLRGLRFLSKVCLIPQTPIVSTLTHFRPKFGMIYRSSSSLSQSSNSSKRLKLSHPEYDELDKLLSDSDGWEDIAEVKLKESSNNNYNSNTNNNNNNNDKDYDDDDDSLIELFENPSTKGPPKSLLGASSKLPSNLPFKNPIIPNGNKNLEPLGVSTQRAPVVHQEPPKEEPPKEEPNINGKQEVKEEQGSVKQEDSKLDEASLEMVEEKKKVQYGEKFALLTQREGFSDTESLSAKLNLAPSTKIVVPIRLSKEQEDVIHLAKEGHNIFYTGSAGTGKSVLLREMIKVLKSTYGSDGVAITASTGLAACNIGGITVHSFAGVGLGNGEADKLCKKVRRSKKHVRRWQEVSALVIDEISMLDGELLDKLNYIAKKIRRNDQPFGDIQLIFCGDFFQLPPVNKNDDKQTKFAFESNIWREGIDVTIMLEKVFRQQGDTKFVEMLNKMRLGKIDEDTETEFKKLNRPLPEDEIIPAELYSTRHEVERANNFRLRGLPGKVHLYHAIDGGSLEDESLKEKLLQNFLAPKELSLKVGAQVMMIKNIDASLVNGSLGKVIDFMDPETYMFYDTVIKHPEIDSDSLEALRNPEVRKRYFKEQKMNEDDEQQVRNKGLKDVFSRNEADEPSFELGDTIFDFLKHSAPDGEEERSNIERKMELIKEIHRSSKSGRKLPLVRFKTSDAGSRTVLVEPEDWAIEDENERPLVSRVQLPLMLAWSLSIHKSQGQTLPKVKVDLRRVFERGQAYVALSRAVSREGLQVLNFDKTRIKAHQRVVDFYSTLSSAEQAIKAIESSGSTRKRGRQRKLDFAPNRPVGNKRTKDSKSNSATPVPAVPDRIMSMLRRKTDKQPSEEESSGVPLFKPDIDVRNLDDRNVF
ncbi:hypothetical protein ZYGR_0AG06000 [Zygosaccharomyces rouxii]|uniref:ATP-dependent DNA helicase PIF1 n=1 Tax=Zygosaccharomyces rouxii TaxID=4956 RepID=A0A1Q3AA29_ZYGRO|nr:hypothetical protein ZYGR_0AG06000 [Zygosaccharomyces rouxii]